MEQRYEVKVELLGSDFKQEMQRLIDEQHVDVIIMGNRRTDPWSADLEPICESTPGWPPFKRVFPILDWSYV